MPARRVLLQLSGESLCAEGGFGIDAKETVALVALACAFAALLRRDRPTWQAWGLSGVVVWVTLLGFFGLRIARQGRATWRLDEMALTAGALAHLAYVVTGGSMDRSPAARDRGTGQAGLRCRCPRGSSRLAPRAL